MTQQQINITDKINTLRQQADQFNQTSNKYAQAAAAVANTSANDMEIQQGTMYDYYMQCKVTFSNQAKATMAQIEQLYQQMSLMRNLNAAVA